MAGQFRADAYVKKLRDDGHLDAAQGVFFARELEHISQKVREKLYPLIKYRSLIPMCPDQPTWADESYTYYVEDRAGATEPGSSYETEAPRVRTGRIGPFTSPIKPLTAGYGWSMQDIRANAQIGRNLPVREAMAARDTVERGLNKLMFVGDTVLKIPGFLTSAASVPTAEVSTGTGGAKTWAAKIAAGHPEEVYNDLVKLGNLVSEQSGGNLVSGIIVMPLAQFNLITSSLMSTLVGDTIARRFLQNSPYVKELDWAPEFKGNAALIGGTATKDVACGYARDPDVVNMILPVDYEELSPEIRGYNTLINVHARAGGCKWEKPLGGNFIWGL